MAYATSNPPVLIGQPIAGKSIWGYTSTDAAAVVAGAGYFTNGHALGMKVGDVVFSTESDNSYAGSTHIVTAVTVGGAATVGSAT